MSDPPKVQMIFNHDLEGYFESLAEQGFQNNPFFRSGTKKWELALPKGALTFQVVFNAPVTGAADNVEGDFNVNLPSPETVQELAQELDAALEPLTPEPSDDDTSAAALQVLEKTPQLKQRLLAAIAAGSVTAIEEFCNHPLAKVALSALKAAFPNTTQTSETRE